MLVPSVSILTGKLNWLDLPITRSEYQRFRAGELAQHVWPNLTPEQRDFLILGVTPDEVESMLPPEDE